MIYDPEYLIDRIKYSESDSTIRLNYDRKIDESGFSYGDNIMLDF